jgi:hypothetical protein
MLNTETSGPEKILEPDFLRRALRCWRYAPRARADGQDAVGCGVLWKWCFGSRRVQHEHVGLTDGYAREEKIVWMVVDVE